MCRSPLCGMVRRILKETYCCHIRAKLHAILVPVATRYWLLTNMLSMSPASTLAMLSVLPIAIVPM